MSAPKEGGFRLDAALESMAAPQLIRIAERYAPGQEARQIQKARQSILRALGQPKTLAALVSSLTPLESFMLGEVRRGGGWANGWGLLLGARLRGLKPERKPQAVELYRHFRPATFEGAELIWPLLASGLLMPFTLPNPFVESYGQDIGGSPLLVADERLLAALPAALPRPAAALALPAPPAGSTPQATPPSLIVLQLLEVLRGVQAEGGVALTRQGDLNRAAYKRLLKNLPALDTEPSPDAPGPSGLDLWLPAAELLGLLTQADNALRLGEAAQTLATLSPAVWVGRLGEVYPQLMESGEHGSESVNLAHPDALRAALVGLLGQLDAPTTLRGLETALETLTPAVLRQPSWRGKPMAWRDWLGGTLRGTLRSLGLVALSAEPGLEQAVAPSPALLGVPEVPPSGPAWVVQPNFELVVYPAQLTPPQLEVLRAAQALRFDHYSASYRLTRESVYEALEAGLTLEQLLTGLESASAAPLPTGVRSTLSGWAERRERLVLHQHVKLLEFPSPAERDAHLKAHGGTPIGATLLLPAAGRTIAAALPTLSYDGPPARSLSAAPGGLLKVTGELDFLGRALLAQYTQPQNPSSARGGYALRPPAPGSSLPPTLLRDLEARTKGALPALLRLQLESWSGAQPPPALASVTVLQHPQAAVLLQHPALAPLLEGALEGGLLLVRAGQTEALTRELAALGLATADTLRLGGRPERGDTAAAVSSSAEYEFPEDTRRKRALLEQAIAAGRQVRLMYQQESFHGWYGESRPGKTRQEVFRPLSVYRQGSTPYLQARRLSDDSEESIRIGYVLGIGVL